MRKAYELYPDSPRFVRTVGRSPSFAPPDRAGWSLLESAYL
ncbi:hypothetical protein [Laspinema palackyanum]